jgi:hypothetical protein
MASAGERDDQRVPHLALDRRVNNEQLPDVLPATAVQWDDNSMGDGAKRTYRIRAFKTLANGATEYSPGTNKASAVTILLPPTDLTVSNLTGTSATISWTPQSTAATGYTIYLLTPGNEPVVVGQVGADATSFDVDGLSEITQYVFQVQANSSTGGQSSAPAASAITQTPREPTGDWTQVLGGNAVPYVTSETGPTRLETDSESGETYEVIDYQANGAVTIDLNNLPRHTYVKTGIRVDSIMPLDEAESYKNAKITFKVGDTSIEAGPGGAWPVYSGGSWWIERAFYLPAAEDTVEQTGDSLAIEVKGSDFPEGSSWFIAYTQVDTSLPFVSITGGNYVPEGDYATLTVSRTGSGIQLDKALDVSLEISGNASQGTDYSFPSTVTIPAGQNSVQVDFDALADTETDPDEIATIAVKENSQYGFTKAPDGSAPSVDVMIEDRDACDSLTQVLQEIVDESDAIASELKNALIAVTAPAQRAAAYLNIISQANLANVSGNIVSQLIDPVTAASAAEGITGAIVDKLVNTNGLVLRGGGGRFVALSAGMKSAIEWIGPAALGISIGDWAANVMLTIMNVNATAAVLDELSSDYEGLMLAAFNLAENFDAAVQDGDAAEQLLLQASQEPCPFGEAECAQKASQYRANLKALKSWHQANAQRWQDLAALADAVEANLDMIQPLLRFGN